MKKDFATISKNLLSISSKQYSLLLKRSRAKTTELLDGLNLLQSFHMAICHVNPFVSRIKFVRGRKNFIHQAN